MCEYCKVIEYGNCDTEELLYGKFTAEVTEKMVNNEIDLGCKEIIEYDSPCYFKIKRNPTTYEFGGSFGTQIFFGTSKEANLVTYVNTISDEDYNWAEEKIPIKYCPMCGRKLVEE